MLYEWRKLGQDEGEDAFRCNGNRTVMEAELARLRRENAVLKMERERVKKRRTF